MQNNLAVIVANADAPPKDVLIKSIAQASLVIAADGGAKHLQALGIMPQVLIGDLDSIDSSLLENIRHHSEVYSYPRDKNFTDLMLAMRLAVNRGLSGLEIFSWADERIDFSFGALLDFAKMPIPVTAFGSSFRLLILNEFRKSLTIAGPQEVSILGLESRTKVESSGLEWELSSRLSQSNRVKGPSAEIRLLAGTAAVILPNST